MEKNNKLIAEFMGMTYYIPNDDSLMVEKAPIGVLVTPTKSLKYHESWDWLMPVIHKCFDVAEDGQMSDIMHYLQVAEMGDTYNAVVEFIKEYNQNN